MTFPIPSPSARKISDQHHKPSTGNYSLYCPLPPASFKPSRNAPPRHWLRFLLVSWIFGGTLAAQENFTFQVGTPPGPPTSLVSHDDDWRYRKGIDAPPPEWRTTADTELDASWLSGRGGFGYASNDTETSRCRTLLPDMRGSGPANYTTLYMRKTFEVEEPFDPARRLLLTMDYDDAFVAYLDGEEIRRANTLEAIGVEPAFDSTAADTHESSLGNSSPANPPVTFDLGAVGNRLQPGTHVLAILGLNHGESSSDFIQVADLELSGSSAPAGSGKFLSVVPANTVELSGTNTVPGSTRVAVNATDAALAAGGWSLSQPLAPGANPLFLAALDSTGEVLASTDYLVVSELASTTVSGALGDTTVWSKDMGIIHVTDTVTVPPGGSLNIQPGTVILFAPDASLTANDASIEAAGTASEVIYCLPENGTDTWNGISVSGTGASLILRHVETIAGRINLTDGATGTLEDSYFHDYEAGSSSILHTSGESNRVTLNLTRCHVARYYEILSRLSVNHIEDCLCEDVASGGDGIDFDAGQPGSYIRRCTLRRGEGTNTDGLDMGEFAASGESSRGVLIDSCLIHHFADKGVSMGREVDVTVTNSLIYDVDTGIAVKDESVAGIFNTTIADSNFGFRCYNKGDANATSGGGYITNSYNNILWNLADFALSLENGSTLAATYSDFQATNYPGTGNISRDPLFVDAIARDYRVAPSSPTLGTGENDSNMGVQFPVGGIPGTPANLAALSSGTDPVLLVWEDDADNEMGFVLERAVDAGPWEELAVVDADLTQYLDTDGEPDRRYLYRVKATNASGDSAYSNLAAGTRHSPSLNVNGTLTANTIWNSGIHYLVTESVIVASGATLTIEPGVTVAFEDGAELTVADGGRVVAEGTEAQPILFTRNNGASAWDHITIQGSVGSPESRITYAHFEFNGSSNDQPCIEVDGGTVYLDHLTFGNTEAPYVHVDGASFVIANCHFPAPTRTFEPVHGTQGIKSDGHGIFLRNFWGSPLGYNDAVDFTGGNRPAPIVHFLNNVFAGASDDCLDIDGSDAWIEGNIFLHTHRNGSPDTASGVSSGENGSRTSEITILGNIFYDCDQAAMAKEGNFYTLFNNTIVHQTHVGGLDNAGAVIALADEDTSEAAGMYLEGNIIYDAEQLVRFHTAAPVTFINNILTETWSGPGRENSIVNPKFKHLPELDETFFANWEQAQVMWEWLSLLPDSPALGTGPNGRNKGAVIPLGASLTRTSENTWNVGFNRTGDSIPTTGWPNGSGYTRYKWRLDDGTWSEEIPIPNPITLDPLPPGPHQLQVTARRDSGLYQDDPLFGTDTAITRYQFGEIRISSTSVANHTLNLHFTAQAGQNYLVQYRKDLNPVHPWTTLQEVPAQPTTGDYQIFDPIGVESTRFYRIAIPVVPPNQDAPQQ